MRWRSLIWVLVFSIAMGFLEAAVVVYIRELYYPGGFGFPLKVMDMHIMITELSREMATMIMLLSIAFVAATRKIERIAFFLLAFAIWDIFYYIFLSLILGWPESLLTWDILFLMPVTWVGPVIAPVINSLTMIWLAWAILYHSGRGISASITGSEWTMLIIGSLVIIFAYTEDYMGFMLQKFSFWEIVLMKDEKALVDQATAFIPQNFNWFIFILGQSILLLAIGKYILRMRNQGK